MTFSSASTEYSLDGDHGGHCTCQTSTVTHLAQSTVQPHRAKVLYNGAQWHRGLCCWISGFGYTEHLLAGSVSVGFGLFMELVEIKTNITRLTL